MLFKFMSYIIGTQKFHGCWDGSRLGEETVSEVSGTDTTFDSADHLPVCTPSTEEAPTNQRLIDHQSEQGENSESSHANLNLIAVC